MVKASDAFVAGPAMFGFLAPEMKCLGEAACQQPVQVKNGVRAPSAIEGGEVAGGSGSSSPRQSEPVSKWWGGSARPRLPRGARV